MPESDRDPAPEHGRARLAAAIRHPSRRQIVVACLLALVGFAGMVQVRANEADNQYAALRTEDLISVLDGLSNAAQRADNEIARLEAVRQELATSTDRRAAALRQARRELRNLQVLAGMVPVRGQGITIRVEDPTGEVGINQLLNGVEELRDSGAEAIEFNDQVRLVAQSWFEESERGVVVDGQQLTPPYVIEVIGEPDTMLKALDFRGGFTEDVEARGGIVTTTTSTATGEDIRIDTVVTPRPTRYARSDSERESQ